MEFQDTSSRRDEDNLLTDQFQDITSQLLQQSLRKGRLKSLISVLEELLNCSSDNLLSEFVDHLQSFRKNETKPRENNSPVYPALAQPSEDQVLEKLSQLGIEPSVLSNLSTKIYNYDELSSIEDRLSQFYDIYYKHDWGRAFGIDNHERCLLIGNTLNERYELSGINLHHGYSLEETKTLIERSGCFIFFITGRFVRRYQEVGRIREEFIADYCRRKGKDKRIFVILEKRVLINLHKYFPVLNLPIDTPFVDMTEMKDDLSRGVDDLYAAVMERIYPSLNVVKEYLRSKKLEKLLEAIKQGDLVVVCSYLQANEKENRVIKDSAKRNVLQMSIMQGQIEMFKYLLENYRTDVNDTDQELNNSLHYAVQANLVEAVRLLLDREVKVNASNRQGITPLHIAAEQGNREIIDLLLHHQANIMATNVKGESCIDVAGNEEIAVVLNSYQVEKTLLLRFTEQRNIDAIRSLLATSSRDLDINIRNEDGRTSLLLAAVNKDLEVMSLLLEYGADPNISDDWFETPLGKISFFYDNAVDLLLEAGSKVNVFNIWGSSPLFNACQKGHLGNIRTLLQHNADPNVIGAFFKTQQKCSCVEAAYIERHFQAVEMLMEAGAKVSSSFLRQILQEKNVAVSITALRMNNHEIWFLMITMEDFEGLQDLITSLLRSHPDLIYVKDSNGRVANLIASEVTKQTMNSLFLWYGKYRPLSMRPEHYSGTTYVYKASDESDIDETGNYKIVALKLIRYKEHFLKEISSRRDYGLHDDYILPILERFPADSELPHFPDDAAFEDFGSIPELRKEQAESVYCLVMPFAERNLYVSMKQERFAGGMNMDIIRDIFRQLAMNLEYLHSRGLLHGDIKPLNTMRLDSIWRLIDFDASCSLRRDYACGKHSSAYIPPEAVYVYEESNIQEGDSLERIVKRARVKAPINVDLGAQVRKDELLLAHTSFDIWSLGCILYQLCSTDALPLFQAGQNDNLTEDTERQDNLVQLSEWKEEVKQEKLSLSKDPMARNLISIMLIKEPEKRATMSRILSHPFLTGKSVTRLSDDPAEYDLFLSYRVASDGKIASELFNRLKAAGLKVWWDKACLVMGKNFKESFCKGLISSRHYLCILSKGAINHPTEPKQNISHLNEDSECDNLLLEMRLALELKKLGYIDGVFPVFLNYFDQSKNVFSRFNWECFPVGDNVNVVKSIERSVQEIMTDQSLGNSLLHDDKDKCSVSGIVKEFRQMQGYCLVGEKESAYEGYVQHLIKLIKKAVIYEEDNKKPH